MRTTEFILHENKKKKTSIHWGLYERPARLKKNKKIRAGESKLGFD